MAALYEEQGRSLKFVMSVRIFGSGVSDLKKFSQRMRDFDCVRVPGADFIVCRAAIIPEDISPIIYLYDVLCAATDGALKILGDISTYSIPVGSLQATKATIKKTTEFFSKKIFEKSLVKRMIRAEMTK